MHAQSHLTLFLPSIVYYQHRLLFTCGQYNPPHYKWHSNLMETFSGRVLLLLSRLSETNQQQSCFKEQASTLYVLISFMDDRNNIACSQTRCHKKMDIGKLYVQSNTTGLFLLFIFVLTLGQHSVSAAAHPTSRYYRYIRIRPTNAISLFPLDCR